METTIYGHDRPHLAERSRDRVFGLQGNIMEFGISSFEVFRA